MLPEQKNIIKDNHDDIAGIYEHRYISYGNTHSLCKVLYNFGRMFILGINHYDLIE